MYRPRSSLDPLLTDGAEAGDLALTIHPHPTLSETISFAAEAYEGMLIAALLLAFNIATFPVPPAESGRVDLGPVAGIWYLIASILVLRSFGWLRRSQGSAAGAESERER